MNEALLRAVADRLAISEILARYCRGIDRCDLATLQSAFWEDAITLYGDTPVNAWAWSEQVLSRLSQMRRTQHAISNTIIDLESDTARAETYCRAYHELDTPDGVQEMMVGGRYLDRLERRDGNWRIAHRTYVMDFNQNAPSSAQWDGPMYGRLTLHGARYPTDLLYRAQ